MNTATITAVADAIEISLRAAALAESLSVNKDMPFKSRIAEIVLTLNELHSDAERLVQAAQREAKKSKPAFNHNLQGSGGPAPDFDALAKAAFGTKPE